MAIANKVPDSKGVLIWAAASEALVSHVKEAEQIPFLVTLQRERGVRCHRDLLRKRKKKKKKRKPWQAWRSASTGRGWDPHQWGCGHKHGAEAWTSWGQPVGFVFSFSFESQEIFSLERARRRADLQILDESLEVKTAGLGIIVPVVLDLKPGVNKDGDVVAPSRVWQENGLGVLVELGQEFSSNPQSTSSRDGLARGNLFIPTDDAEQGKKGKEKGKRKKKGQWPASAI